MKVIGLKEFFDSVKASDGKQFVIIAKGINIGNVKEFLDRIYECIDKKERTVCIIASEDFEIEFIEV